MIIQQQHDEFRRDLVRRFRALARFYDSIEWFMPLLKHNPRLEMADAVRGEAGVILDACTGNGAVLAALARTHPRATVHGLDLSEDMLRLAKRRVSRAGLANTQIHTGDCTAMPFDNESFDAVTTSYGLHEMPMGMRKAAVAEAFRVLRKGGQIVVIDWDAAHALLQRPLAGMRNAIEPDWIPEILGDGLANLIAQAGFVDLSVRRDVIISQLVTAAKPE